MVTYSPQAITDPTYDANKLLSATNRFLLRFVKDPRDLPFLYLTLKITITMIPIGLLLFMPFVEGWVWWLLAMTYFILNNFVFKGPFGLMLHCTSHRPLFKREYSGLNHYLPWFVSLFFGHTPETYHAHHIGMHHLEKNLEDDESSTMRYQRDRSQDFHKYYLRFFFLGMIGLVNYFRTRKRKKFMMKVIRGEVLFFAMCTLLSVFVSWQATLMVFIIPFVISRYIMMIGNWAQHAFVDKDDPSNAYKYCITTTNTRYNHKCWNDGYHVSHHIKPAMHWTDHPKHLIDNADKYAANRALVFDGIHYLQIWWLLMRKNYKKLAQHVVNINNTFSSDEEVIGLMRERCQLIPRGTARGARRKKVISGS